MFFSKAPPTPEKVAKMDSSTKRTSLQAVDSKNEDERRKEKKAPELKIITDMKDIPGKYISLLDLDFPPVFVEMAAFYSTGGINGVLLVASDVVNTNHHFEAIRRLQEKGVQHIATRQATREIIKSAHASTQVSQAVVKTKTEEIAWDIINSAVEKHASDIHIETMESHANIYFRINGERIQQPSVSKATAMEICNVLYAVHADADNKSVSWDIKTVRNTTIQHTTPDGKSITLRFCSSPRHPSGNFQLVMRVLVMDESSIKPLDEIGYTKAQVQAIEEMLTSGRGIVLLTGPTNSGKSTSMQSFIEYIYELRGRSIKVVTVEDPVEYVIPDAIQMGVPEGRKDLMDANTGSIFATFLKGVLRQDADVAMIGEIRDRETAENLKNISMTGKKILTTLHVDESHTVYPRLRELGIPESILYSSGKFISGVICQRLLPVLCPHCSMPVQEAHEKGFLRRATFERVLRVIDLTDDNVRVRDHAGCSHCNFTGIQGRTIVAELLVPDTNYLALMYKGDATAARNYWSSHARHLNIDGLGVTMMAHAIAKMRAGMIDPRDIEFAVELIGVEVPVVSDFGGGRI